MPLPWVQMTTWIATDQHGNTAMVSAYTETDARQQAEQQLGHGQIITWRRA